MMRYLNRWRAFRLLLALLIVSALSASYIYLWARPSYSTYVQVSQAERDQSIALLDQSEGKKYVLFKQLRGAGFNNQAQELLLYHHLALHTSRTYVYQPLVMRARGEHSFAPLSAFLPALTQDGISVEFFGFVCPPERVMHITLSSLVGPHDLWNKAIEILNGPDRCLVINDWILNWNYLASPAIHPIWPSFQQYLHSHFVWSRYIQSIADRSFVELGLYSKRHEGNPYVAVHFRRGDFESHCQSLASHHAGFTTWATLPLLQQTIFPPMLNTMNESSVLEHCYPSIQRIVDAVATQLRRKPNVKTAYILHDAAWDHPLVYLQRWNLETALQGIGITRIVHSGMLPRRLGEKDWIVAVDVEMARNSEIFVGIGYSSLSTQVIALRLGADSGRVEDNVLL